MLAGASTSRVCLPWGPDPPPQLSARQVEPFLTWVRCQGTAHSHRLSRACHISSELTVLPPDLSVCVYGRMGQGGGHNRMNKRVALQPGSHDQVLLSSQEHTPISCSNKRNRLRDSRWQTG